MSKKVKFVTFDDPFLELEYDGQRYVYNPEYGSLLSLKTDKLVKDIPREVQEFIDTFFSLKEAMVLTPF